MSQSRQLAAIMFTDIVGYTALKKRLESVARRGCRSGLCPFLRLPIAPDAVAMG